MPRAGMRRPPGSRAQKANATGKITGGRTAGSSGERSARHAYTKAVEWGYVNLHPVKAEVRVEDKKPERATLKIGKLLNADVGIQAKERQRASNAGFWSMKNCSH